MKIEKIPFVNLIDLKQEGSVLSLDNKENVLNHINTIHAGAQFTLAETKSGLFLAELFTEFKELKILPVLRESNIKYKKPAEEKIEAYASLKDGVKEKFETMFLKKGRASIEVDVLIKDINGTITAQASFNWYIQRLD